MSETQASKRARAIERLRQQDAGALSDRAIARELNLSQPFISSMRKRLVAPADLEELAADDHEIGGVDGHVLGSGHAALNALMTADFGYVPSRGDFEDEDADPVDGRAVTDYDPYRSRQ